MNIKSLSVLALVLLLSACLERADTPKQVAQKYWHALQKGDHATVRQYASKASQENLNNYLALPPDQKTIVHEVTIDTEHAAVNTTINPNAIAPDNKHTIETILVLEDGQWKVDASRTQLPPPESQTELELEELADQLSESMKENIESMDGALSEGMEMLNNALRDGSKDMGESMLKLMKELNESMKESVEQMKQRNQQQQTPPPNDSPMQPDPNQGEGVI